MKRRKLVPKVKVPAPSLACDHAGRVLGVRS